MYNLFLEDCDLLEAVEIMNIMNESYIEESSFLSKLFMQPRVRAINKKKGVSITSMEDLIKHHHNPGLLEIVKTSKDIDELEYIKKDTHGVFPTLEKIKERIGLCRELGETSKTSSYYKYIKKHYIDKGITEKDVDKTIEELKKQEKLINERIKELKKAGRD
jgi:DNA replicative helicase MCM subunit Mcm2 (Cdc46/Mcm family)